MGSWLPDYELQMGPGQITKDTLNIANNKIQITIMNYKGIMYSTFMFVARQKGR